MKLLFSISTNPDIPASETITLTCEAYSSPPDGSDQPPPKKEGEEPVVQSEGPVQFAWALPVKNGPLYEIHLKAFFVLPEVVVSSEHIDFKKVLVGQKKCITVSIKNRKPVPVEWSYKAPKGSYGKQMAPWDMLFNIKPESGLLQPDELQWVQISFTPNAVAPFRQRLALRIKDNPHRKVLTVTGQGEALQMGVSQVAF